MKNPYFIDEPAAISFSGGRTSAYMLAEILEAHGGALPNYLKVVFANTGMEFPATYDFIERCAQEFAVDIVWVEYDGKKSFKATDYKTASRNGEPFEKLIEDKKYLPNMIARFCTVELKILTIERYMKSIGMGDYLTVVGIRADEPRRVAKQKAKADYLVPLSDAKVTIKTVREFWGSMPWNLELPMNTNGSCSYSNCTLCFLKGHSIKLSLLSGNANLADWWINQENKINARFRTDQPSYAQMKEYALSQGDMFADFDDESIPCFCGD